MLCQLQLEKFLRDRRGEISVAARHMSYAERACH
jgi:hypothetical protein